MAVCATEWHIGVGGVAGSGSFFPVFHNLL